MSEAKRRSRMRVRGFDDGLAGRPRSSDDPDYLISHRRGRERAEAVKEQK